MTNKELARRLAERMPQLTERDCQLAIKLMTDAIGRHICSGGKMVIRNFLSLEGKVFPRKTSLLGQTGERGTALHLLPKVRMSRGLWATLNPTVKRWRV